MDKLGQLRRPFHPDAITFKPGVIKGNRALGLAYADLRAYMDRLDEVFGQRWEVSYTPWGEGRIIATVTVEDGTRAIRRSSTGETSAESERSEIGGTVAEAQAFKRACAMLGLGRYLYALPQTWADFDPQTRGFTPAGLSQLRRAVLEHYTEQTGEMVAHDQMAALLRPAPDVPEPFGGHKEDVGFMPEQAAAAVPERLAAWVAAQQAAGGRPASEKQLPYLFKQLEFAAGKGSNGAAIIRSLVGDAEVKSSLASALIDAVSRKHKPEGSVEYVENPKYNADIVAAIKEVSNAS